MLTAHRHFLSDGEVIIERMLPVDQPDVLGVFANIRLDLYSVRSKV